MDATMHDGVPALGLPRQIGAIPARRGLPLPVQFVRYLACAGLAALVNFAAGSLLVDGFGFTSAIGFPLAVAGAYAAGMAVNLLLNRRFTFVSDRTQIEQARTFIVIALSGLALTTAIAALARIGLASVMTGDGLSSIFWGLATPESLSRALAIAVVSAYSFAGHKYFTFNRGIRRPLWQLVQVLRVGGPVGYD